MARLMVVDDDESVRCVLRTLLIRDGHEVQMAASVDEALSRLATTDYDVIITDIIMPKRSGLELLGLIRDMAPEVKVVLVTGEPSYETAAEAVRKGAFDYVAKPLNSAVVKRCVDNALNVKALEDRARKYREDLENAVRGHTQQLDEWSERLRLVADQARDFSGSERLVELAPQVLALLTHSTLADGGSFYVRTGDRLDLVAAQNAGHAARRISLPAREGSVVARRLEDGKAVLVADIRSEEGIASSGWDGYRDGSFIGLPCAGPDGSVEALIFLYSRRDGPLGNQDLAVARIIAIRCEEALRRMGPREAAGDPAAHVPLTHPQLLLDQAEQIFSTVRHEIGNALNTLKTTLSVLRTNVSVFDAEKREEYFQRCFESLRLAERMLHALRAFQRFDLVQPEMLDLRRFLAEKEALIFEAARARGVVCRLDLFVEPVAVNADPDALLRILLNLVENSLAALGGRPEPEVTVTCRETPAEAEITVGDNGAGIETEHLERVFEPLFTTRPQGTGMGLAIVQKLVTKMGGLVELRSQLGHGTTVELRFPRHRSRQESAVSAP